MGLVFMASLAPIHYRISLHKAIRKDFPSQISGGWLHFHVERGEILTVNKVLFGCKAMIQDITELETNPTAQVLCAILINDW